jgi:hypothetical protein
LADREEIAVPKRKRPPDDQYYLDDRTEHVSQGDLFHDIPFHISLPDPEPPDEPVGIGFRRVLETPLFMHSVGMLVSHSSSFMAQPVGTRGYAHVFRSLVPVLPLGMLEESDLMNEDQFRLLRKEDKLIHYMYLPPCPGMFSEERVALLYRPSLIHHDILVGRRGSQLTEAAMKQLQAKLVEVSTGRWIDPEQFQPTTADHWNP